MQLEQRTVRTSKGDIPLWGRFGQHDASRPVLLVIRGAFGGRDDWTILVSAFPQADVVLAHLPGMYTPFLDRSSVPDFAAAFDEVITRMFANRRVVVMGLSIGGLVAMSLKAKEMAAVVACDPPLSTIGLWPMRDKLREIVTSELVTPSLLAWVENIFGVTPRGEVNVDYRGVLGGTTVPTSIVVGGVPLEPERALAQFPSFVSSADREVLNACPGLEVMLAPDAGHNLAKTAAWLVVVAVNGAILTAQSQIR
ncbi:alpha/beta fold hydrolase [Phenylobacterium aquaticum]|uniref:alpha/beta fold hydrolase n=1 Tax=Phenylobacterium aquaticum TaxID=1763816 RepID=UPI0026F37386|nr:alpha/beta hydrolase family protein [Phenylobacterium aquaticum]